MCCPTLNELPPPPPGRYGWPWIEESPQLPDTMPDGNPWPWVSIITPSYNQGQFIEETIRSVLLQGYPNLEYLVIDGGSTDESVDIIRKYEPWLAYWVSEPDRGQTHAINKGWARCRGEIIAYLNSDDTYQHGTLYRVVKTFQRDPQASFVFGACNVITEVGEVGRVWYPGSFCLNRLIFNNYICQQAVFFQRQVLDQIGALDERFQLVFDYEYWLRAGLKGLSFKRLSSPPLANFRQQGKAKSWTQYKRFAEERLTMVHKHFPEMNEDYTSQLAWGGAYYYLAAQCYLTGHVREALLNLGKSLQIVPKPFLIRQARDFLYLFVRIAFWIKLRPYFAGGKLYLRIGGVLNKLFTDGMLTGH